MGTHCGWNALSDIEQYDGSDQVLQMMDSVAKRLMQGKREGTIAKELGIKRVEVLRYRDLWRDRLQADHEATDSARDHLNQMVEHYSRLIEKSYDLLADLKALAFDEKIAAQINTTLKNISEYEKVRVDFLQKAGLLDGASMGDQMAEAERKHQIIVEIMRNDLCPVCRPVIMTKLRQVTGKVEVVQVYDDTVDAEIVEETNV